ncbi:aspartic peptidase domain-containing protein [Irpex lacteus]|nr:aspartic peptidase domain-containing protein [Irpex lacteus]
MHLARYLSATLYLLNIVSTACTQSINDPQVMDQGYDNPTLGAEIPLTFDSSGNYVADMSISRSPTRQNFYVTFTTSTGLTFIAGTGGNLNSNRNLYNQTDSLTAQVVARSAEISLFGEQTNTTVVKETCALFSSGGGQWHYENQTVFVVNNMQHNILHGEISGVVGLGTNRRHFDATSGTSSVYRPTLEDSMVGQWLRQSPTAENFTFGLSLEPPVKLPQASRTSLNNSLSVTAGTRAGTLQLLPLDQQLVASDSISWIDANVNSYMASRNGSIPVSDWTVVLDGWSFTNGQIQSSSTGEIVVDIDPIYTNLYLPRDQALLIHAAIPGAVLQEDFSTLDNLSQAWTLPCDSQFAFTISVNGRSFVLDQSKLVVRLADGICVSGIEAWTNAFETTYVFGSRFISSLYLIFNVPRTGVPSIGFANKPGSGIPPPNRSSMLGPIIGGALGGAALVILSIIGIVCLCRNCRRRTRTRDSLPAYRDEKKPPVVRRSMWHLEPFTLPSPTSVMDYHRRQRQHRTGLVPSRHAVLQPRPSLEDRYSISVAPPTYASHSCRRL